MRAHAVSTILHEFELSVGGNEADRSIVVELPQPDAPMERQIVDSNAGAVAAALLPTAAAAHNTERRKSQTRGQPNDVRERPQDFTQTTHRNATQTNATQRNRQHPEPQPQPQVQQHPHDAPLDVLLDLPLHYQFVVEAELALWHARQVGLHHNLPRHVRLEHISLHHIPPQNEAAPHVPMRCTIPQTVRTRSYAAVTTTNTSVQVRSAEYNTKVPCCSSGD